MHTRQVAEGDGAAVWRALLAYFEHTTMSSRFHRRALVQQTDFCRGFFSFFFPNTPFHFTPLHSILSNILFAHLHCILFSVYFSVRI